MSDVFRWKEWSAPVEAVQREVLTSQPLEEVGRPPILFVPGYAHGAWSFAEKWLEHAAGRGYPSYAMSLRGHGESGSASRTTLRAFVHDVVQVAARLPRQAVLVGHGVGGLAVAQALSRYPARAGVLVAPVTGGLRYVRSAFAHNLTGLVPALVGASVRHGRRAQATRDELVADAAAATREPAFMDVPVLGSTFFALAVWELTYGDRSAGACLLGYAQRFAYNRMLPSFDWAWATSLGQPAAIDPGEPASLLDQVHALLTALAERPAPADR